MEVRDNLFKKWEIKALSGLVGAIIGLSTGFVISVIMGTDPKNKAKIFSEPNEPKVLRVNNYFERDDLFVEDTNDPDSYRSLPKHLESIPNKYDRQIEESRIKKLVDW